MEEQKRVSDFPVVTSWRFEKTEEPAAHHWGGCQLRAGPLIEPSTAIAGSTPRGSYSPKPMLLT